MKSINRRFRKTEPQRPPVPAVISSTCSLGYSDLILYDIKSTVPPPASQTTKQSPTVRPWGSSPCNAEIAAASYLIRRTASTNELEIARNGLIHTGSDASMISDADFRPAFWQALSVFSFAASDQIAGTVRQNSIGIVRRIPAPIFCSRV